MWYNLNSFLSSFIKNREAIVIQNSSAGHQRSLWVLKIVRAGTGQEINIISEYLGPTSLDPLAALVYSLLKLPLCFLLQI